VHYSNRSYYDKFERHFWTGLDSKDYRDDQGYKILGRVGESMALLTADLESDLTKSVLFYEESFDSMLEDMEVKPDQYRWTARFWKKPSEINRNAWWGIMNSPDYQKMMDEKGSTSLFFETQIITIQMIPENKLSATNGDSADVHLKFNHTWGSDFHYEPPSRRNNSNGAREFDIAGCPAKIFNAKIIIGKILGSGLKTHIRFHPLKIICIHQLHPS